MTTINSQEDFLRALAENPEWRAAVRAQLLGEDILQLPSKFDAFVERMDAFIEEQKRFNAEMKGFVAEMKVFVEEQKRFNDLFARRLDRMTDDIGFLKGWFARVSAVEQAPAIAMEMGMDYVRTVTRGEVANMAHRAARGSDIPTIELRSFVRADVVIEATLEGNTQYIAAEASYTADHRDTDRALRNAEFLTRFTGIPAHAAIVSVRNDRELDEHIIPGNIYWYPIPDYYWEPE